MKSAPAENSTYLQEMYTLHWNCAFPKWSVGLLFPWSKTYKKRKAARERFYKYLMFQERPEAKLYAKHQKALFNLKCAETARDGARERLEYWMDLARENRLGYYEHMNLKDQ